MKASGVNKSTQEKFTQRPQLLDAKKNPIASNTSIWGGSIMKVAYQPVPYYTPMLGAGVSLRLKAAQIIKLVVKDQINDGKSEKEIYDFLIEKYGEWIVYKPPLNKVNFVLWLLPYLVFITGGAIIFLRFKKRNYR